MKEINIYLAQQLANPQTTETTKTQSGNPSTGQNVPNKGFFGDQWGLIMMASVFVLMYFLLIFPQRKEEKKRKAMLATLQKGDSIVTSSGIIGTVASVKENTVLVNVGDNTRIEFLRTAISSVKNEKT